MKILLSALVCIFINHNVFANVNPTFEQREVQLFEKFEKKLQREIAPVSRDYEPDKTHVQFSNSQAAIDWTQSVAKQLALNAGAKKFEIMPLSDPRYLVLQGYVDELWMGFQQLFPRETAGLNTPPVVLVDSEVVNAFVPMYILEANKIAHAIVVFTALLDTAGGVDQRDLLTGVFAHEISHSVFRHALEEYRVLVNKFYENENIRIGFKALRNSQLDESIGKWAKNATLVGDLTSASLKNLPSNGGGKPILMRVWSQIKTDLYDASLACWRAYNSYDVWSGYQRFSRLNGIYSILDSDLSAVASSSSSLIQDSASCLQDRNQRFLILLSKATGIPLDVLEADPDLKKLEEVYAQGQTPVAGLQNIVKLIRPQMVDIEDAHSFEKIGFFTYEEHADDVALIVHKYLGWDPMSLANFFEKLLDVQDRGECAAVLATGELPGSGSFSDSHRSTCFRIGHLQDLGSDIEGKDVPQYANDYIKATLGD